MKEDKLRQPERLLGRMNVTSQVSVIARQDRTIQKPENNLPGSKGMLCGDPSVLVA
jgi:hypothetical protein